MRIPASLALVGLLAPGCILPTENPLFDGSGSGCSLAGNQGKAGVDGTWYDTLAEAIEAAPDGGTVLVCPGDHEGNHTIDKSITLVGRGDRQDIVLRGTGEGNPGSVLYTESGTLKLENLTITGGTGTEVQSGNELGGGVMAANSTAMEILDCIIEGNEVGDGNSAGFGGGVMGPLDPDGDVIVRGSIIRDNLARYSGGGLYLVDGEVIETEILRNEAIYGGGLAMETGTVTVSASAILANVATDDETGGGAFVAAGVLRSEASDWGTNDQNNVEGDIYLQDSTGFFTRTYFDFGDNETFTCDAEMSECD